MIISRIADVAAPTRLRGVVPTMGALHQGHLSLIQDARWECEEVVATIFVNPTQFGPNEDFARYPRQLEIDAEKAYSAGADWIFAPSQEEMYPRKTTAVVVREVTDHYEGALRPGHFDGVATIVLKLFNIIRPNLAYFGRKDLQQCQVILRMVEDLNVPVGLRFCETIREADGLAMSSRNIYLNPDERSRAPALYRELLTAKSAITKGASKKDIGMVLEGCHGRLREIGFNLDYFDLIDLDRMAPTQELAQRSALAVAAKIGQTRLIDNVTINP